jgi:23S rRNA pseudouridine1911/1915/1917 synthase
MRIMAAGGESDAGDYSAAAERFIPRELAGLRLDQALARLFPEHSRTRLQTWVRDGRVTVDAGRADVKRKVWGGERVALAHAPAPADDAYRPQAIALAIVHEDDALLVVDKPAGLVVHPAAGHRGGTLVHALLHHCRGLSGVGGVQRPGIVHRLDKDTSGLMVVAKSDVAHRGLAAQFHAHTIEREYAALVRGAPRSESGSITAPIGRGRADPRRFTVRRPRKPRSAATHWKVAERLPGYTLLHVRLETGRTHQIRVHLASAGLPVAGDPLYGGGRGAARELGLGRQALHARLLGFVHPVTGARLAFESDLPPDFAAALARLRA